MQKNGFSANAFLKNLTKGIHTLPSGYRFKPSAAISRDPEIVLYPLFKEKNKGDMKDFLNGATTLYYFWFTPNRDSLSSPTEEFDTRMDGENVYPVFFFSKFLDRSYFGAMTPTEIAEILNSSPCYYSDDNSKTEITFVNIGGVDIRFNNLCEDKGYNLSDLSFPTTNSSILTDLMALRKRYFNFQPADALILKVSETKELELLMSLMIYRALIDYRAAPFKMTTNSYINKTYFPSLGDIVKGSYVHNTYGTRYTAIFFGLAEIIDNLATVSQALPAYSIGNTDFRSFNQRSLVNYIMNRTADDLTDALDSPPLSLRNKWKMKLRL